MAALPRPGVWAAEQAAEPGSSRAFIRLALFSIERGARMDLGTLFATLSVKDSELQAGVENAKRRLQEVGAEADRTSTRSTLAFKKLGAGAGSAFRGIAAGFTTSAAAGGALITNLARAGVSYNKLQQNSRAALTTLLGGAKQANEQMDKLDAFAKKSPFAKQVFITAQQQLLGFGMEAKKVIPTMDALQNAVAATGGSSQQLSELAFVLAQIQAAGKITGQDLMQLGQRGVNAADLIGQSMGKTGAEVKQMITKGQIDATAAIDAIVGGMTKKFGGATDLVKKQFSGALDRVAGAKRDIGAALAEPFVSKNGGGAAVDWVNLVADGLRKVEKLTKAVMGRVNTSKGVFGAIGDGLRRVNDELDKVDAAKLLDQLSQLKPYVPVIAGLGGAFSIMGLRSIPVIGALAGGLNPLVAGLVSVAAASPQMREALGDAAKEAGGLAPVVGRAAKSVLELGANIVSEAAPGVGALASGLVHLVAAGAPLVKLTADVLSSLTPLIGVVGDLAGLVANLPTPVLMFAAALTAVHVASGAFGGKLKNIGETIAIAGMYAKDAAGKMGVLGAAMNYAKMGIKGVGLALKSAFISNPIGLAIAAITTVIAGFAEENAEAKAETDEMTETLNKQTGAVTEATRALVAKKLEEKDAFKGAKELGIANETLVSAVLGSKEAMDEYTAALERHSTVTERQVYGTEGATVAVRNMSSAISTTNNALGLNRSLVEKAQEAQKRQNEAVGEGTNSVKANSDALEENRRIQEGRTNALIDAINAAHRVHDAQKAMNRAVKEGGKAVLDSAGHLDMFAEANRGIVDALSQASRGMLDQLHAMDKQGSSQDELNAKVAENREALRKMAEQAGITGDAFNDLADQLGVLDHFKSANIHISADDKDARKKIDQTINLMAGKTGKVKIDANKNPAIKRLLEAVGAMDNATGIATLDANDDRALLRILTVGQTADKTTGTVTIDGNTELFQNKFEGLRASVRNAHPEVAVAMKKVGDWDLHIPHTVDVRVRLNGVDATGIRGGGTTAVPFMAHGGIIEHFAAGGLRRENHQAQIAPAGAWRVWAEPETHGEAYIPLALSKRARSMQIMAEVANRFGAHLVPKAQKFADGGMSSTPSMALSAGLDGTRLVLQLTDRHSVEAVIREVSTAAYIEGQVR